MIALAGLALFVASDVGAQPCPPDYSIEWGSQGSGDGSFSSPYHLDVDPAGFVYVCDSGNHRIQKFTGDGLHVGTWGSHGSGNGQFSGALTIAVDDAFNVFVADYSNARIQKFTSDGTFIGSWGTQGSAPGQFYRPRGISVDDVGHVYIADTDNNRIQKFTGDGVYITEWSVPGPFDVSVDGQHVYVADFYNFQIRKYTVDGASVAAWGTPGPGNGQFDGPFALCTRNDLVYVADSYNQRIQVFTESGIFVTKWGQNGYGAGSFNFPRGVAVASDGVVYVSDTFSHRVQKFTPDSEVCPPPGTGLAGVKILVHLAATTPEDACEAQLPSQCADAVVSGQTGVRYFAYLMVADVAVLAGVQLGIAYGSGEAEDINDGSEVDVFSWTLCAHQEFPTAGPIPWPGAESGNIITWDSTNDCQSDIAVAGYFYLTAYTPDRFSVTPRPVDGLAKVADCYAVESGVLEGNLGFVTFSTSGNLLGCNPCTSTCTAPIAIRPTTWGSLKALYYH
jgi:sugar lactone lactonase YvrE